MHVGNNGSLFEKPGEVIDGFQGHRVLVFPFKGSSMRSQTGASDLVGQVFPFAAGNGQMS